MTDDGLQQEITALKARLFELDKERETVNVQLVYKIGYAEGYKKGVVETSAELERKVIDGIKKMREEEKALATSAEPKAT